MHCEVRATNLFTDDNDEVLFSTVGEHNHETCPDLHTQYISKSVKRKANEPPAKAIRKEIVSASECDSIGHVACAEES